MKGNIMSSNKTYTSDQELTELYSMMSKEMLVKMLIEKFRQSEKKVKRIIPNVSKKDRFYGNVI